MSIKAIDLGWCIARVDSKINRLVIASPSDGSENSYTPSESVTVYGEAAMKTLRDALIEMYPIEI